MNNPDFPVATHLHNATCSAITCLPQSLKFVLFYDELIDVWPNYSEAGELFGKVDQKELAFPHQSLLVASRASPENEITTFVQMLNATCLPYAFLYASGPKPTLRTSGFGGKEAALSKLLLEFCRQRVVPAFRRRGQAS